MTSSLTEDPEPWVPPGRKRWLPSDGAAMCEALKRSGLSKRAFARKYGVTLPRVDYWSKHSSAERHPVGQKGSDASPTFVPVHLTDVVDRSTLASSLTLVAPDGWRVVISEGISSIQLAELLATLRKLSS